MRKLLIVIILVALAIVGLNMNKHKMLFSFGQFLMDCRMNDAAHFVMLCATHSDDPILRSKALTQVARVALRQKRPDAGFAFALKAVKEDPKNYDAWFVAAGSAEMIGSMTKAQLTVMNAKKIEYFNDADMKSMNERALKYIDQAMALNSSNATYFDTKVALLGKLHRFKEAKAALDIMINKFPGYGGANYMKNKGVAIDIMIADEAINQNRGQV